MDRPPDGRLPAGRDDVAVGLSQGGFRVLAPDMRGFGDGARISVGGYYYFPDYVSDLAGILALEARAERLFVIGHSMGATVVTYLAGAFPERVTKLALIDGVGPPHNEPDVAPIRMRRWIEMAYGTPVLERKPMLAAVFRECHELMLRLDRATFGDTPGLRVELGAGVAPIAMTLPDVLATDVVTVVAGVLILFALAVGG